MCFLVFFKQNTAYDMRISDWSSDVCSSDLLGRQRALQPAKGSQPLCQRGAGVQAGRVRPDAPSKLQQFRIRRRKEYELRNRAEGQCTRSQAALFRGAVLDRLQRLPGPGLRRSEAIRVGKACGRKSRDGGAP